MAKKVKFELNLKGLNELMKSSEMQAKLKEAGKALAQSAGDGFDNEVHLASFVAISNVFATTYKARRENLKENTLIKAIGTVGLPMHK